MKDLKVIKDKIFSNCGIYDNKRIYENTTASFQRALKNNYPIKIDLHLTKDNKLIIFQDDNTERLLHIDEEINKLTYEEILYLSKYKIPTIEETLELVKGQVPLLIELKGVSKKRKMEKLVANIMSKYNGPFALCSKHMRTVTYYTKKYPNFIVGYVLDETNKNRFFLFRGYDFLNIDMDLYDDRKVRKLRESTTVLGHIAKDKEDLLKNKRIYDNLICDNLLEIDTN